MPVLLSQTSSSFIQTTYCTLFKMEPELTSADSYSIQMNSSLGRALARKYTLEDNILHMRNAVRDKIFQLRSFLTFWYFQWELASCMYIMDQAERVIFGTVVVAVLSILLYAAFHYIPGHIIAIWTFFCSLVTNNDTH